MTGTRSFQQTENRNSPPTKSNIYSWNMNRAINARNISIFHFLYYLPSNLPLFFTLNILVPCFYYIWDADKNYDLFALRMHWGTLLKIAIISMAGATYFMVWKIFELAQRQLTISNLDINCNNRGKKLIGTK